jgi:drug/metabolite transporter (DMT)-like permease
MIDNESDERTPLSIDPSSESVHEGGDSVWNDLEWRRGTKSGEAAHQPSTRNRWLVLLSGQLIALVAISQNAASFTLEYGMGKVFPCFLMLHTYIILSIHLWFTEPPTEEESFRVPMTSLKIRTPWWYCLLLSILDVTPNYLTLLSLKHTSLTSSTLLGSLTAPSIMLSCHFLLRKTYRPAHYLGVLLCISGGMLTVWTDLAASSNASNESSLHPHSYFGDILALIAAILYGLGDAIGEFWCKHVDRKEYLGMLGFFGTIICSLLVILTEREAVVDLFQDSATLFPALGIICLYVPTLVLYYVSASIFLVSSDATLLNLSLQSSNLWAICFSVIAFQESPSSLFYTALVLVLSGVFVYELLGNTSSGEKKENVRQCSEPLNHQKTIAESDFC